jgi:hypothetical protein
VTSLLNGASARGYVYVDTEVSVFGVALATPLSYSGTKFDNVAELSQKVSATIPFWN